MIRGCLALLALTGFVADGASAKESRPTCVVLSFASGRQADASEAAMLANRFAVRLDQAGPYHVLPRVQTNRQLAQAKVARVRYATQAEYALAVGRALGVDYVVFGAADRAEKGLLLSTSLADVAAGKVIRTAVTAGDEPLAAFGGDVCLANLSNLLDVDLRQAASKPLPAVEMTVGPEPASPTPVPRPEAPRPEAVVPETPPAAAAAEPQPTPEPPKGQPPPERVPKPSVEPPPRNAAPVERDDSAPSDEFAEFRDVLAGRLSVGARITDVTLTDDRKTYFLGLINRLDGEDDYAPWNLFVQAFAFEHVGAELGWVKVEAAAVVETGGPDQHTDGVVSADGPVLFLVGRARLDELMDLFAEPGVWDYPWASRVTPYAGVGMAFLSGSFDPEAWYSYDYPSKEEWIAAGKPMDPQYKDFRQIEVDDGTGLAFTLGSGVNLAGGLGLDLNFRYIGADLDAVHNYPHDTFRFAGSFDLSHYALGLGARYDF